MSNREIAATGPIYDASALAVCTGLAFASLILVPAIAASVGLGPSLTGALRMYLMKASSRAIGRRGNGSESVAASFSCH
ncbi:hypothetical protein F6R98_14725 [Candidatus Methylospira mobilis]|uniref:Uncharacterized protein n=1 Tax=Candidatus Methylospira mobilis TaxID=1808979 RepID=A0A5Q0BNE6_9GAMM|nr:hypothetical protein [Candidatus Methylospira mobilis]QFY43724.1 hypothetical protein F6R98_14725 [Candidatus Methylospira mobilis]WNV04711.1 hypothetical protein RP726_20320 [Candidatus Methylospira mobilis]